MLLGSLEAVPPHSHLVQRLCGIFGEGFLIEVERFVPLSLGFRELSLLDQLVALAIPGLEGRSGADPRDDDCEQDC
jgi:hypothetical protein